MTEAARREEAGRTAAGEHVEAVRELITPVRGPRDALIAAEADFRDASTAARIEWACEQAEDRLRTEFPVVGRVYLHPAPGYAQCRSEGLDPWP